MFKLVALAQPRKGTEPKKPARGSKVSRQRLNVMKEARNPINRNPRTKRTNKR